MSPSGVTVDSAEIMGGGADSVLSIASLADFQRASFALRRYFARAAAYSPDRNRPPFYAALPVRRIGGQVTIDPGVLARWRQESILSVAGRHHRALRTVGALAIDVGDEDQYGFAAAARALDSLLTSFQVAHTFQVHKGHHSDRVQERLTSMVLPFFSHHLYRTFQPQH